MGSVNYKRLIERLTIIIVPMFIYAYYTGSLINSYAIYFVYILIVSLVAFNSSMRISLSYKMKPVYIGLFIAVFFFPVIFFHINSLTGVVYSALLCLFLLSVDVISQQLVGNMAHIITWWVILGTIVLDVNILINATDINSNTLTAVFFTTESTGYRYRAYFGFQHPNSIAAILVGMIILYYWLLKNKKELHFLQKLILVALIMFHFVCLCCTGSRTALISLFVFSFSELFLWVLIKYTSWHRVMRCCFILVVLFVILRTSGVDLNFFAENSSGRYEMFTSGFGSLIDSGGFFWGTIVTNISGSSSIYNEIGLSSTDSWYYTFLLKFGIVGLSIFLIPILSLFISEVKNTIANSLNSIPLSAMLMLLIYGIAENIFFNQGIMLSFIVWELFIENMYENEKFMCKY